MTFMIIDKNANHNLIAEKNRLKMGNVTEELTSSFQKCQVIKGKD